MLTTTDTAAPQPFHLKPAATQAGMLCASQRFQIWLRTFYPSAWELCHSKTDTETAAAVVRHRCGVDSRRQLNHEPGRSAWGEILAAWVDYDTGRL